MYITEIIYIGIVVIFLSLSFQQQYYVLVGYDIQKYYASLKMKNTIEYEQDEYLIGLYRQKTITLRYVKIKLYYILNQTTTNITGFSKKLNSIQILFK